MATDRASMAGEAWYSERRWGRFAPLTGLLAVLLWIIGVAVLETAADPLDDDAPAAEFASYFEEGGRALIIGAFLIMVGAAVFVWFLGTLRDRLRAREGGTGRMTATVFALGIVVAVMMMAFVAPEAAGAFAAVELDAPLEAAAAQALGLVGDGFFIAGEAATAIFFLAVAVAILRTGALPVWLAWASIVLGIAAFIPPIGWAVFVWGVPLWTLVVSILMFIRPGTTAPASTARPGLDAA